MIVGEDDGEGSSIMQERSHAFAMKSQIWLLDPRPDLPDGGGGEARLRALGGELALTTSSRRPLPRALECVHRDAVVHRAHEW